MFQVRATKPKGFTLIELSVVIAIIAALALLFPPAALKAREAANRISTGGTVAHGQVQTTGSHFRVPERATSRARPDSGRNYGDRLASIPI